MNISDLNNLKYLKNEGNFLISQISLKYLRMLIKFEFKYSDFVININIITELKLFIKLLIAF